MALARTNLLEQSFAISGGSVTRTTDSFTPPNNCLLVLNCAALIASSVSMTSQGGFVVTGGGLTWTRRHVKGHAPNDYNTEYEVWTAPVTTGASMTITMTCNNPTNYDGNSSLIAQVMAYTGYNVSDPIGATAAGNTDLGTGAASITLSAAPALSSIVWASARHHTSGFSGSATPAADFTEIYDTIATTDGYGNLQCQERTNSVSTTVGWADIDTVNDTDGHTFAFAMEIKADGGGGGVEADFYQSIIFL